MTEESSEDPCIGCLVIIGCENMCVKAKVWYDSKTVTIPDSKFDWHAYEMRRDKLFRDIFEKRDTYDTTESVIEDLNLEPIEEKARRMICESGIEEKRKGQALQKLQKYSKTLKQTLLNIFKAKPQSQSG